MSSLEGKKCPGQEQKGTKLKRPQLQSTLSSCLPMLKLPPLPLSAVSWRFIVPSKTDQGVCLLSFCESVT